MAESLVLRGELVGHSGWVTSISTPLDPNSDIILSSSRYHAFGYWLALETPGNQTESAGSTTLFRMQLSRWSAELQHCCADSLFWVYGHGM